MSGITAWEADFVALDIETTGLSPAFCKIVEIAALRFRPGEEGTAFQRLVNPGCPIPESARAVHGISDAMVKDQPAPEEAVAELLDFVQGSALVLHNPSFDLAFLNPLVKKLGRSWGCSAVFDTLTLSRAAFPGMGSYSLSSLSRFFEFSAGKHHRALADCRYCSQLFSRILEKTDQWRCLEMEALIQDYSERSNLLAL